MMDWLLPDISTILATIVIIFFVFLKVGSHLKVKETFFQLWVLAWLLSIIHYVGQMIQAGSGGQMRIGGFIDRLFLAYSAIVFIAAAESLRGRQLKRMLPYGLAIAAVFTLWACAIYFRLAPQLLQHLPYGAGLGAAFGAAGVSHWIYQRKKQTVGGAILACSFFFWSCCFFAFVALANTPFLNRYIQYMYQFSNLPKPIAAISMLIFLLEGEKVSAQRQRDFSDSLIESASDGIFVVDANSCVTRANSRFVAMCGLQPQEIIGKPLSSLFPPSEAKLCQENLSAALDGSVASYDSKLMTASGVIRQVLIALNPILGEGNAAAAMGIVKNVTEREQLEQQLRRSEKMASIGMLASGIAHELNNPLTSIIGFTDLALRSATVDGALSEQLNIVLSEARRTQSIVQKLLRAVRQQRNESEPVNINQLIEQTISLREYDFARQHIAIKTELAPNLPLLLVSPSDLQQVLINLLQNSHDALAESGLPGKVTIRTRLVENRIVIEVLDNGPGVAEPDKIFDPFYTTKEVGKGTGLGLSICYQTVRSHGGEISIENLSPGVKFTIQLPVTVASAVSDSGAEGEAGGGDWHSRVLIVDDELMIRRLIESILSGAGFAVETASSGDEAVLKLERASFDVIVTDYKMPGSMSGADLYNWLRENQPGREANVIFITGDGITASTYEFLQSVENPVIFKPFEPEQLISQVKSLLRVQKDARVIQMPRRVKR